MKTRFSISVASTALLLSLLSLRAVGATPLVSHDPVITFRQGSDILYPDYRSNSVSLGQLETSIAAHISAIAAGEGYIRLVAYVAPEEKNDPEAINSAATRAAVVRTHLRSKFRTIGKNDFAFYISTDIAAANSIRAAYCPGRIPPEASDEIYYTTAKDDIAAIRAVFAKYRGIPLISAAAVKPQIPDGKAGLAIYYRWDKWALDSLYLSNRTSLRMLDMIIPRSAAVRINTITVAAFASPEGDSLHNRRLSERRAETIRDYIVNRYPWIDPSQVVTQARGENWEGMEDLAANDPNLPSKEKVLGILRSPMDERQKQQAIARLDGGETYYRYILPNYYTYLRVGAMIFTDFKPEDPQIGPPQVCPGPVADTLPIYVDIRQPSGGTMPGVTPHSDGTQQPAGGTASGGAQPSATGTPSDRTQQQPIDGTTSGGTQPSDKAQPTDGTLQSGAQPSGGTTSEGTQPSATGTPSDRTQQQPSDGTPSSGTQQQPATGTTSGGTQPSDKTQPTDGALQSGTQPSGGTQQQPSDGTPSSGTQQQPATGTTSGGTQPSDKAQPTDGTLQSGAQPSGGTTSEGTQQQPATGTTSGGTQPSDKTQPTDGALQSGTQPSGGTQQPSDGTTSEGSQQSGLGQSESSASGYRFALKTNLLYDLVGAANLGVEVPIGDRWSVVGDAAFAYWRTGNNLYALQTLEYGVSGRYWLPVSEQRKLRNPEWGKSLRGWNFGVYGRYWQRYDVQAVNGCQGDGSWSAGVTAGYAFPVGRNLSMEAGLGAGYFSTSEYRTYDRPLYDDLGNYHLMWRETGKWRGVSITKLSLSLVWLIETGKGRTE